MGDIDDDDSDEEDDDYNPDLDDTGEPGEGARAKKRRKSEKCESREPPVIYIWPDVHAQRRYEPANCDDPVWLVILDFAARLCLLHFVSQFLFANNPHAARCGLSILPGSRL